MRLFRIKEVLKKILKKPGETNNCYQIKGITLNKQGVQQCNNSEVKNKFFSTKVDTSTSSSSSVYPYPDMSSTWLSRLYLQLFCKFRSVLY